jgi:hypothetical protein
MTGGRSLVALSVAVLTIGGVTPAVAAPSAPLPRRSPPAAASGDSAAAGAPAPAAAKKPGGRKVVRLEEMRVEGRIQKPQALMLMPRASVASGDVERTESFLSEVKDATRQDPF